MSEDSAPVYRRTQLSAATRAMVWDNAQGACRYCGKRLHPFRDFQVDHIVPVSRGGTDAISNLTASCVTCNSIKGTAAVEEMAARVERRDATDCRVKPSAGLTTLREWRKARHLSTRSLAALASISNKTLIDLEYGRRRPHYATIARLSSALCISPREVAEFDAVLGELENAG